MKLRVELLVDFILMFLVVIAVNALRKLHSVGQPLLGLVTEAILMAAGFSLLKYVHKHWRE